MLLALLSVEYVCMQASFKDGSTFTQAADVEERVVLTATKLMLAVLTSRFGAFVRNHTRTFFNIC